MSSRSSGKVHYGGGNWWTAHETHMISRCPAQLYSQHWDSEQERSKMLEIEFPDQMTTTWKS